LLTEFTPYLRKWFKPKMMEKPVSNKLDTNSSFSQKIAVPYFLSYSKLLLARMVVP